MTTSQPNSTVRTEPACEGHPQLAGVGDGVHVTINKPTVHPEPVLEGCGEVDGLGASIYGSVVHDGGVFRMWYQAWPLHNRSTGDSVLVACAESDDGIEWRRPHHGVMEWAGDKNNHLTDLPFHSPAVIIDPTADPEARYRAFGCTGLRKLPDLPKGFNMPVDGFYAYYSAHSADGLHFSIDGPEPAWPWADVITAAWNPWAGQPLVCLKHNGRSTGLLRRRFCTATWTGGRAGPAVTALIPDEYDDVIARARGFASADYYGMGLMPGPSITVGFLWNFRHLPPSPGPSLRRAGRNGAVDISLVYQTEPGGRWQHLPGRPDWMTAAEMPEWAAGALYTAASPLDVGDETWLYFTGTPDRHGWAGEDVDAATYRQEHGLARIGLARWPRGRLMGFRSRWRGIIDLRPASGDDDSVNLTLNLTTGTKGRARVQLMDADEKPIPGFTFADCEPIRGDHLAATVRWRGAVPESPERSPATARIELEDATLYGFSFTAPR